MLAELKRVLYPVQGGLPVALFTLAAQMIWSAFKADCNMRGHKALDLGHGPTVDEA